MKSLEYYENYQNVKQRHEVIEHHWETWCQVATDLQFVKTTISAKCHKAELRSACIVSFSLFSNKLLKCSWSMNY